MARSQARRGRPAVDLERERARLRNQQERERRALEVLYTISLACRGRTSFREILDATYRELAAVFVFDACCIAVCDPARPDIFRAVLMVDEDIVEYEENTACGYLSGMLLERREPLLYRDLAAARELTGQLSSTFGHHEKLSRAWLGVPLFVGPSAVGVVSIQSYRPGAFSEIDRDLLQRMANVVAVALENVSLAEQQQALGAALATQVAARTEELIALSAIAAEMVRQQPLPRLLDVALDRILGLLKLDGGNIRLLDTRRDALVLLAQRGFSAEYVARTAVSPLANSPIREVVTKNRPQVIAGGLQSLPGRASLAGFESLLSVPLRIGQRVLGTMSLFGRQPRDFDDQHINLAQAIGNQVAIAIEIARLFEERERQIAELRALSDVSLAAITAQEPQALLRRVHDALHGFLKLDAFSMVIYDPDRDLVAYGISIDEGSAYDYAWNNQPPPEGSFTAYVLRNRRPLHFRNIDAEIGSYPELKRHLVGSARPSVSWLGVPFFDHEGRPSGMIAVQGYSEGLFSERDETFLSSVARQIALHVQNVRLLAQRERQIRELDAIGQIGQLIAASYDLEEMLEVVYQALRQTTGAAIFYLVICDPDTGLITNSVFIDRGQRTNTIWQGRAPLPGSLTAWIMTHREPLLFYDASGQAEDMQRLGITPSLFVGDERVRAWVGVPLLAKGGEPIGVLSLQGYQPYLYDDQTIDFLSQVASHISLGVQKVRLFEEREGQVRENARLFAAEQEARRDADTLREVARVLSASFNDPDEVLELILRELGKVIPYDSASIMLVDGPLLRVAACRGWEPGHEPKGTTFAIDGGGAGRVVRQRRPLMTVDNRTDPEWVETPFSPGILSWLGVPLISRGAVLGVLNIDSRQPGRFKERDVEVTLAFASQAAVALDNARLYQESVARVEQEMEIARRIQSNLFPRSLPAIAGISLAARCLPARETGGDFYDVVVLGEQRVGVIVGDVSGKSLPAAMLMAVARSVARSEARNHETPHDMLVETGRWLAEDVPRSSFVALCYATIDLGQRRLALANAGQLTPIRRRADGSITYLQPPGLTLPLGIVRTVDYQELVVDLEPGDTLFFYTDGIVEAKDCGRHLLGFEWLEAVIRDHGDLPPAPFIDMVLAAVNNYTGNVPQHDDMTMLVVRVESDP